MKLAESIEGGGVELGDAEVALAWLRQRTDSFE